MTHIVTHKAAPVAKAAAAVPASASVEAAATPEAPPVQSAAALPAAPAEPANNELPLEFGAGALALFALGGAAFAVSRRRRSDDEEVMLHEEEYEPLQAAEPTAEPEALTLSHPVVQEEPAMIVPPMSAFAWGREPGTATEEGHPGGETWVERAYRGSSPENPSVSLKARLKRAAFFDKREREVAAGEAEPIDADAGLPEALSDDRVDELA